MSLAHKCLLLLLILVLGTPALAQKRTDEEQIEFLLNQMALRPDAPLFEKQVNALIDYGEMAVPSLIECAKDVDNDENERINCIYTIGRIGKKAEKAVFTLHHILKSKHSNDQMKAVTAGALGRIGRPAGVAIPTLEKLLYYEGDTWVNNQALRALEDIGTRKAREVVATYKQNLELLKQGQKIVEPGTAEESPASEKR